MIGPLHLAVAVLVTAVVREAPRPADADTPVDPKDVEFRVEVVGASPLPFQAVRLRASLKNVSAKRIGPVAVDNIHDVLVKGPGSTTFREADGALSVLGKGLPSNPTDRPWKNLQAAPNLEPGEETSASFAVAAHWVGKAGGWLPVERVKPLFSAPGKYTLKLIYQHEYKARKLIAQSLEVRVREPEGRDKAVYEELRKDPEMVGELLCPVGPPSEGALARMRMLRRRHPASSYTPYLWFAEARFYLGKHGEEYHKHQGTAAAALAKAAKVDWAYQPNALVVQRWLGPVEKRSAEALLKERYRDAIEWLEAAAGSLTPEQWEDFRKRGAPGKPPSRTVPLGRSPDGPGQVEPKVPKPPRSDRQ